MARGRWRIRFLVAARHACARHFGFAVVEFANRLKHLAHFLPFMPDLAAAGLAAARFTEYAMATACLTGFPAATSALMLDRKAFGLVDLTSGMVISPS